MPNKEEQEEEKKPAEDKPMKTDADKEAGDNNEDEEEEEEITPAKIFNDRILKSAGLGDSAGDLIASFHDLPLQVPRGKYTLDMFTTYAKFHGRTHDYKIMYKDIQKVF